MNNSFLRGSHDSFDAENLQNPLQCGVQMIRIQGPKVLRFAYICVAGPSSITRVGLAVRLGEAAVNLRDSYFRYCAIERGVKATASISQLSVR